MIALFLLLLLGVGGCSAPDPEVTAPAVGEPVRIRVLAYNIRRGWGTDERTDISRAGRVIREPQPDLVALQEIDKGVLRSGSQDQMQKLAEMTGMEARFGAFLAYMGGEYGMGLLSRFPILSSTNYRLPDGLEPRTTLMARVELPEGGQLILSGIHFYRTEEERLAQARAVLELYRDESTPVILAGDFNSRPGSAVMELIEGHWVNTDKGEDHLTFSSTDPRSEIDFILYSPRERFEVVSIDVLDEPLVSDHRPVLMVLELK